MADDQIDKLNENMGFNFDTICMLNIVVEGLIESLPADAAKRFEQYLHRVLANPGDVHELSTAHISQVAAWRVRAEQIAECAVHAGQK